MLRFIFLCSAIAALFTQSTGTTVPPASSTNTSSTNSPTTTTISTTSTVATTTTTLSTTTASTSTSTSASTSTTHTATTTTLQTTSTTQLRTQSPTVLPTPTPTVAQTSVPTQSHIPHPEKYWQARFELFSSGLAPMESKSQADQIVTDVFAKFMNISQRNVLVDITHIGPGNETNTNFVLVSIIRIVAKSQTFAKIMTAKALTSQNTISPLLDNLLKKEFKATAMTNWVRTATDPPHTTTTIQPTAGPSPSSGPQPPDGNEWFVIIEFDMIGEAPKIVSNATARVGIVNALSSVLNVSESKVNVNITSYHVLDTTGALKKFSLKAHVHVSVVSRDAGRDFILVFGDYKYRVMEKIKKNLGVNKASVFDVRIYLAVKPGKRPPTEPSISVVTVVAYFLGGIGVLSMVCLVALICYRKMQREAQQFAGDNPDDPNAGINLDSLLDPQIPLIDDVLMSTPHNDFGSPGRPWTTPGNSGAAAFYRPDPDEDLEEARFQRLGD